MKSTTKTRLALISIFLLTFFAALLVFPNNFKSANVPVPAFFQQEFSLGLDLQGGAHLIYQADLSQIAESEQTVALEGVRDVIERRVNAFGVSEPVVQAIQSRGRISVELAGVYDINEAISLIGETPLLEFKEQNPNPQVTLTEEQKTELETYNSNVRAQAEDILAQALEPTANFAELAQTYSQDPGTATTGGALGPVPRDLLVPEFSNVCFDELEENEVYQELVETQFGYHIIKRNQDITSENSTAMLGEETDSETSSEETSTNCSHILLLTRSESFYLDPNQQWINTALGGKQLQRSQVAFDPNTNEPLVILDFDTEGAELFAAITERNLNRPVAIFLDGEAISTPVVNQVITGGSATISGNFTIQEARLLAQRLNAGALPVSIELISQQTIGASLGQQSITKSVNAGIIGLIAVAIFMILVYRLPGIVAVVALIIYSLIVLALFKLINVTLTLSGAAGFILSLGMAVDANILIFERIKEELRSGKNLHVALKEGFKRAWPSIKDGNISTILTCLILIGFTTSIVRGFAITLFIGILVSMFTAMIITKSILQGLARVKVFTNKWLFCVKN